MKNVIELIAFAKKQQERYHHPRYGIERNMGREVFKLRYSALRGASRYMRSLSDGNKEIEKRKNDMISLVVWEAHPIIKSVASDRDMIVAMNGFFIPASKMRAGSNKREQMKINMKYGVKK